MNKKLWVVGWLMVSVASVRALSGCHKTMNTRGLTSVTLSVPAGFPPPVQLLQENPLTQEGIELGRRLFYEPLLSVDNEHPCASCHEQRAAFGTFEHDRSHGVFESHTLRNAPVLFNLNWYPYYHWDGAFQTLEAEAIHPLTGQTEMGEQYSHIKRKLEKVPYYRRAFREVFNTIEIAPYQILRALAQFTSTMISASSKYDQVKNGTATFTAQENNGYQIFKAQCATCHTEPLFTDFSFRNTGLSVDPSLKDVGRQRVTGKKEDSLKFRVPTLRNVALSSNYMHDGRFLTLQQCINHYRVGIINSATLDPLLRNGITLSDQAAIDLISFLKTLTDSSFVQNPKLSRPE
jgi:cytochrome c peroxidase